MNVSTELIIAAFGVLGGVISILAGTVATLWRDGKSKDDRLVQLAQEYAECVEKLRAENLDMLKQVLATVGQNAKAFDGLREIMDIYPRMDKLEALIRESGRVRTTTGSKASK